MPSEPTFQLFTSLRYDPLLLTSSENSRPDLNFVTPSPFYMLAYHCNRMLEAAQHFDFHAVAERLEDGKALHQDLIERVDEWKQREGTNEPLKVRVLFDKEANMTVDLAVITHVPLTTLYPTSFDLPNQNPGPHPANTSSFQPSPLTGGALCLGPTDSLSASPSSPPEWTVKLDTAPTPPSSFTLLKTTKRDMYDSSRNRALPPNPTNPAFREVMLYNSVNELTEGTLTSLYLYRGGRWVTPPVGVPSTHARDHHNGGNEDEGELREPFPGRWGHSIRSAKVGAGGQRGTSRRWALGKGFCMEEPVGTDTIKVGERLWVSNGVRGFGLGKVVE